MGAGTGAGVGPGLGSRAGVGLGARREAAGRQRRAAMADKAVMAATTAGRRIRNLARSNGAPRATKPRTSARLRDEHPENPGSEVRRNLSTYVPGDSDQPRTTGVGRVLASTNSAVASTF